MKKTLISLTVRQAENLAMEAKKLGISKSELLRRIMDRYLDGGKRLTVREVKIREKRE